MNRLMADLKFGEAGALGENELELRLMGDGRFHIEIDNPWAGDTETGFGYITYFNMTANQAKRLKDWLIVALEAKNGPK